MVSCARIYFGNRGMQYLQIQPESANFVKYTDLERNTLYSIIQGTPLLWTPLGPVSKLVLLMEVSFIRINYYQNGTRKESLVVRCPLLGVPMYRGVLY